MHSNKTAPPKKARIFHMNFSLTSIFFWGLGLFFLLGWIFVLGILVGRGFFNETISNFLEVKTQVNTIQNLITKKKVPADLPARSQDPNPKMQFLDALKNKKKQASTETSQASTEKHLEHHPAKQIAKKKETSQLKRKYTLQLASFIHKVDAVTMVNKLLKKDYPAYFYPVYIKGKIRYRVRCGKFQDKIQANNFKLLMAKLEKIDGFITTLNN